MLQARLSKASVTCAGSPEGKSTQSYLYFPLLAFSRESYPGSACSPVICRADIRDGDVSSHAAHLSSCEESGFWCTGGLQACSKCWWHHSAHGDLVQETVFHRTRTIVTTSTHKSGRLVRRRSWITLIFPANPATAYEYRNQVCATAASMGSGKIRSLQQNTGTRSGDSDTRC